MHRFITTDGFEINEEAQINQGHRRRNKRIGDESLAVTLDTCVEDGALFWSKLLQRGLGIAHARCREFGADGLDLLLNVAKLLAIETCGWCEEEEPALGGRLVFGKNSGVFSFERLAGESVFCVTETRCANN